MYSTERVGAGTYYPRVDLAEMRRKANTNLVAVARGDYRKANQLKRDANKRRREERQELIRERRDLRVMNKSDRKEINILRKDYQPLYDRYGNDALERLSSDEYAALEEADARIDTLTCRIVKRLDRIDTINLRLRSR